MPEIDEVTPSLTPAVPQSKPALSPLRLPSKRVHQLPQHAPTAFDLDGPLSPTVKAAASALFVLSSTKAPRYPEPPAPVQFKRPMTEEEEERMSKRVRSSRCGTCSNCLRPDCGECINCSDKPKFGGPGVKKQACSQRKCLCPNRALNFQDEEED